jgi:hypothetical protein
MPVQKRLGIRPFVAIHADQATGVSGEERSQAVTGRLPGEPG